MKRNATCDLLKKSLLKFWLQKAYVKRAKRSRFRAKSLTEWFYSELNFTLATARPLALIKKNPGAKTCQIQLFSPNFKQPINQLESVQERHSVIFAS